VAFLALLTVAAAVAQVPESSFSPSVKTVSAAVCWWEVVAKLVSSSSIPEYFLIERFVVWLPVHDLDMAEAT
jgi:hypothetical protein